MPLPVLLVMSPQIHGSFEKKRPKSFYFFFFNFSLFLFSRIITMLTIGTTVAQTNVLISWNHSPNVPKRKQRKRLFGQGLFWVGLSFWLLQFRLVLLLDLFMGVIDTTEIVRIKIILTDLPLESDFFVFSQTEVICWSGFKRFAENSSIVVFLFIIFFKEIEFDFC